MSNRRFACTLQFADAWRATAEEIGVLLDKMTDSFVFEGIEGLTIGGDIEVGSLEVAFDLTDSEEDDDSLLGIGIVVRALNNGRVSAPGWPDDEVVDGAMASVKVREVVLA